MAKQLATRSELLDRWRGIEEEEDEDHDSFDPSKGRRLHHHKEQWFADTFKFLMSLPKEDHIWCGSWDLMGPLLETFYNYFKDERDDSPLRQLWRRISKEMQHCIQCVTQHHQAQEMYVMEYELSSIGPLLDVLRSLDEERVFLHLREINAKLTGGKYDPAYDNAEVICVMYEVLMFPVLLDDQSLFTEFEKFIEAIDNVHELALDGQQQFPGVYALFFFKRRVRSIGHRLARSMGKLRSATDLEPLQPLLKKFIGFLETEALPSTLKTSRPRAELDRLSVWLGIKSLLGFLEPPAFEEGILEPYPIFLDIVLNHISGDSMDFSHSVTCLRLLFEILGCKLWLRSTLSPSVMRNTLLGQCFHTRNEKNHKDIFDLFQPFLQSLEALQDGEHEKQRRNFLYFLLHQVPVSSNFSVLTRQKARQIALVILHRGYAMDPPSPPFECVHMWGPSLVLSLKDSSLHNSLRQPAFDLIQTILVSDASALINSRLSCSPPMSTGRSMLHELNDNGDDEKLLFDGDAEVKDDSSWRSFSMQSKIIASDFREWMCIPMLWIDVLVDINPSILPISVLKAVFWARSRFSMVETEISSEMALPVRTWLSSSAPEISESLRWKVPTGSDDGGDEKEPKNSIKVSTMSLPLIRTFNRLTAHFLVQVGQGELRKQWTWEPRMGESLILSLFDPNDMVRQFGKCILEQVSNTRGLACGLEFLCSYRSALSAILLGMRHAVRLVLQLDSVVLQFQTLQHFFFVAHKLLNQSEMPTNSSDYSSTMKFSTQGGFLKQPVFCPSPVNVNGETTGVDFELRQSFCCLLSEIVWPSLQRCLVEGKAFLDNSSCQITCVRLLETLPIVFEKLYPSFVRQSDSSGTLKSVFEFSWLHDLMDWGKSSLKVVVIYWRRAVTSLLKLLKGSCKNTVASTIKIIEDIISCDSISMEDLTEHVSRLSVALSKEALDNNEKNNSSLKSLLSGAWPVKMSDQASDMQPLPIEDTDVQILDSALMANKKGLYDLIVLSDDEEEVSPSLSDIRTVSNTGQFKSADGKTMATSVDESTSSIDLPRKKADCGDTSKDKSENFRQKNVPDVSFSQKGSDKVTGKVASSALPSSEGLDDKPKEIISENESLKSQVRVDLRNSSTETVGSKKLNKACNAVSLKTNDTSLRNIVCDAEDDPLESALNSVRSRPPYMAKPSISIPKRQLIQLGTPNGNRSGRLQRMEAQARRFKPPRLDDWYKPILEIDYFATVGLASPSKDDRHNFGKLKEIPVCFQSSEQYVEIFRPLVLEELKAQLQSSFLEMPSREEMYFGILSVLSVERVDDFHLVRFSHEDCDSASSKSFFENDLVLLTKEHLQKSSHDIHMVGKVERRERDHKRRLSILLIRFYLQNGTLRLNQARRNLLERSKWHASRIMSIITQLREFQALSSIKEIPLLPTILNPINDSRCSNECKEVNLSKLSQPLQQILKSSFNDSQLQAVSVAFGLPNSKKDFELSLIQGPPGTGKTKTILAIVSCLISFPLPRTDQGRNPIHGSSKQMTPACSKISQSVAIARAWQDMALAKQLNDDEERYSKSMDACVRRRVLVCAQSNAAVDELVSRISSQGLYGSDGKTYKPYVVRVGNPKTVHPTSLPFFIDTLVDQRLEDEKMKLNFAKNDLNGHSSTVLRSNLEKLVDRIRFYEAKRANLSDGNSALKNSLKDNIHKGDDLKEMSVAEVEMKLRKLYEQKKQIYKDLSTLQVQERKINEEIKGLRNKLRKSILREAEIVLTTLSGCGGDLYGVCSESMSGHKFGTAPENTLFDAVVIDEAAQALEPATLIPLQLLKSHGIKCIMVGDPKQLPATVLSNVASKFLYECSMFERLQRAGHPVVMLTKQYRMHPEICHFPSLHFYERKLLNGVKVSSKTAPFHETEGLGPYVFYDIVDGRELQGKNSGALSLYNEHEADAAVEVIKFFKHRHPSEFVAGRIGIITPYKSQLSLLRSRFSSAFGSSIMDEMELNTVDGFQGREVDILILSTVRAGGQSSASPGNHCSSIGFVADVRRMNVALTRAKFSLWIMGNAMTLQTNKNWAALIKDATERNLVITVRMPYRSMFKSASGKDRINNFDPHLVEPRSTEMVEDAKQKERRVKENIKRKENYTYNGAKRRDKQEQNGSSAARDNVRVSRSDRDELDLKGKDPSVVNNENKSLEEGEIQGKGVCGKKVRFESSRKTGDHSEQGTGVSHKSSKSQVPKEMKSSSEGGPQKSREVSTSSAPNKLKERDSSDRARDSNQVGTTKDLISKRKEQREAVDAILFSSLISSQKPQTSNKSLPSKRPSSSSTSGGIRPSKSRKG